MDDQCSVFLPPCEGKVGRTMPFHDGAYYPYTSDTQGTHSSTGIPSFLNSSLSLHSAPSMTPSTTADAVPFKFHPHRESVDWRRISAVGVDLVASQLDVGVLQEHITGITFCSLQGERCQSPVDLRYAQHQDHFEDLHIQYTDL